MKSFARLLAWAWVLVILAVFVFMLNGFKPYQALLLAVWVAVPIPLTYWIGSRLAGTPAAWAALAGGLAAAFLFAGWLYWDAFLGRSSREESLAGLIVLYAPIYQITALAIALLAVWLLTRAGTRRP